jgi:hypothetical protein
MIFINNEDIQGLVEASKYLRRAYTEPRQIVPIQSLLVTHRREGPQELIVKYITVTYVKGQIIVKTLDVYSTWLYLFTIRVL